jgi:superfamily II DNA or RNA helicase
MEIIMMKIQFKTGSTTVCTIHDPVRSLDEAFKHLLPLDLVTYESDHYIYNICIHYTITHDILDISRIDYDDSEILAVYPIDNKLLDYSSSKFLREDQYEILSNHVLPFYHGTVNLDTGFGKTTMIVYIAQSYVGSGNILILCGNYNVVDEIKSRLGRYDTNMDNVKVINQVAFMSSNRSKDPEYDEWFSKVELIIIDECDNMTPSLYQIMNKCSNARMTYGLSANVNKYTGEATDYKSISKINYEVARIVDRVGFSLYNHCSFMSLSLNIYKTSRINPEPDYLKYSKSPYYKIQKSLDSLFNSKILYQFIEDKVLKEKDHTLFIAIRFNHHGKKLYDHFKNKNLSVILWTGTYGITHNKSDHKLNMTELKELVHDDKIDLMIASSVAYKGIDMSKLSDLLFLVGSQFGIVNQIAGRIMRYISPTIWMLQSTHNKCPIYNISHYSRIKRLKSNHDCTINTYDLDAELSGIRIDDQFVI